MAVHHRDACHHADRCQLQGGRRSLQAGKGYVAASGRLNVEPPAKALDLVKDGFALRDELHEKIEVGDIARENGKPSLCGR